MTLIEAIQGFHLEVTAKPLSANARSLWLAIICLWNDRRRPRVITVGTPELRRLAGIKAKTTYHDALAALLSRKFVKVRRRGDLVELELIPFGNPNPLKSETLLNIPKKAETEGAHAREGRPPDEDRRTPNSKFAGMTIAEILASRSAAGAKVNPSPEKGGES